MEKHLSNKYGAKPLDSAKESTADAIKTASKRAIQKSAEVKRDLIGKKKIANKITSKTKKSNQQEADTPKEIYISPEKIQEIIDSLSPRNNKLVR